MATPGRFVLVSYLRSGTHMLRTALESHPAVFCQTELFNPDNPRLPYPLATAVDEVLGRHAFGAHPAHVRQAGFVLHSYHPFALEAFPGIRTHPPWAEVWPRLDGMAGLRVLHLKRRNLLRRHLSHLVARASRFWHSWEPEAVASVTHLDAPPHPDSVGWRPEGRGPMEVDGDVLERDFLEVERWRARADAALASRPCLEVVYEDLCADFAAVTGRLLAFLGLPDRPLAPAVRKLEGRPLRTAIVNYDALAARFARTRFAAFFDE